MTPTVAVCVSAPGFLALVPAGTQEITGTLWILLLVPLVGALLGVGSVALSVGVLHFQKHPVLLPSHMGLVAGAMLFLAPQLGALHSPFMKLAFTLALLTHFAIAWEWYSFFQPYRTLLVGIELDRALPLIEEASAAARDRLAAFTNRALDPGAFELKIGPHPRMDHVVVIGSDPRAFVFVLLFRIELRRILMDHPMHSPGHTTILVVGGALLIGLAFWLASLVA